LTPGSARIVWVGTAELFLWSAARSEWVSCPADEITWLDRRVLSADEDLTLHRAPRCAGLRYVHHRWELFSRDTTYRVYLTPDAAGTPQRAEAVQRTARHVLPVAPARYEALPAVLAEGSWPAHIGTWGMRLRLAAPASRRAEPAVTDDGQQETTRAANVVRRGSGPGWAATGPARGDFRPHAT